MFKLVGMSRHRTYLPPWISPQHAKSPEISLDRAHEEALVTAVGTVQELLNKTGVRQRQEALQGAQKIDEMSVPPAVGHLHNKAAEHGCLLGPPVLGTVRAGRDEPSLRTHALARACCLLAQQRATGLPARLWHTAVRCPVGWVC